MHPKALEEGVYLVVLRIWYLAQNSFKMLPFFIHTFAGYTMSDV